MKIVKLKGVTRQLKGFKKPKRHILDSRKPDEVKLKLHMAQLFTDLKHYYDEKRKKSTKSQTDIEKSSIETQADMDQVLEPIINIKAKILEFFTTPNLKSKAESLMEKMSTVMSWNKDYEIIHKGKLIKKSDIRELIDYLIRRKTTRHAPFYYYTLEEDLSKLEIGDLCVSKVVAKSTRSTSAHSSS
jgi:hypothetical protein